MHSDGSVEELLVDFLLEGRAERSSEPKFATHTVQIARIGVHATC